MDFGQLYLRSAEFAYACWDVVDHVVRSADVVDNCRRDSYAMAGHSAACDAPAACDALAASVAHSLASATSAVSCVDPVADQLSAAVVDLAAAAGQDCVVNPLAVALPIR